MPEARDRLTRNEDLIEIYARRVRSRVSGSFQVFEDEPQRSTFRAPLSTPATIFSPEMARPARRGRGYGRVLQRTPARAIGRENISPAGRRLGRGGTVLPSWYPRRPLQDITSIVRAIERTRARVREREGEQPESVVPQEHAVAGPSESTSGAQLEHNKSVITPHPTIRTSRYYPNTLGKVPKILLDITHQNSSGDSEFITPQRKLLNSIDTEFITPQRKLLNSIDTVEKAVMEELNKLKRTPSARKQEREKKVRTLMSMR